MRDSVEATVQSIVRALVSPAWKAAAAAMVSARPGLEDGVKGQIDPVIGAQQDLVTQLKEKTLSIVDPNVQVFPSCFSLFFPLIFPFSFFLFFPFFLKKVFFLAMVDIFHPFLIFLNIFMYLFGDWQENVVPVLGQVLEKVSMPVSSGFTKMLQLWNKRITDFEVT